jgi:hypothetical protein
LTFRTSGRIEQFRQDYDKIADVHQCKTHLHICTFQRNATFCCGVASSQPAVVRSKAGEGRGKNQDNSSMLYSVFGALRTKVLKRFKNEKKAKKADKPEGGLSGYYSEGDDDIKQALKDRFYYSVYKRYWEKVNQVDPCCVLPCPSSSI